MNDPTTSNCLPSARELHRRATQLIVDQRPRYRRLWSYYHNPMRLVTIGHDAHLDRPNRQAQARGLPTRITGVRSGSEIGSGAEVEDIERKEVVVENDIAWRIETMVDYLFGRAIVINSAAPDPSRRADIEQLIRLIFAHNGGITFLQQLALLAAVYGFVDVLVKFDPAAIDEQTADPSAAPCSVQDLGQNCDAHHPAGPASDPEPRPAPSAQSWDDSPADPGASQTSTGATLDRLARSIRLEIVEPARALPFLSARDWRVVEAFAHVSEVQRDEREQRSTSAGMRSSAKRGWLDRFRDTAGRFIPRLAAGAQHGRSEQTVTIIDLITPTAWQRYEDQTLVAQGANSLGRLPLVHIQNTAAAFAYSGNSEVEPLIPLQDELNTRLSDRAYRITMQSSRMYLGKGIENFTELPIGPGRMWATDNENAQIIEVGGQSASAPEQHHIDDIRQALDKASGVTPIAAGAIRGRIGNLTSAAALRVTMLALLARTERKRTIFGSAIQQICDLALAWLDVARLFPTHPDERRIEIHWPSPLPENQRERVRDAAAKLKLGVPQETILRELGY